MEGYMRNQGEVAETMDAVNDANRRYLFWACFVALVATSFAFIIRVMVMDSWQVAFR